MPVKIFAEDSTNVYDNSNYASLEEVENGFQPNTSASSRLVNSVLKVLTKVCDAVTKNSDVVIGPSSTDSEVKRAVRILNEFSNTASSFLSMSYKLTIPSYDFEGDFYVYGSNTSAGTVQLSFNFSGTRIYNNSALTNTVEATGGSGEHPAIMLLHVRKCSDMTTIQVSLSGDSNHAVSSADKTLFLYGTGTLSLTLSGPFTASRYVQKYTSFTDDLESLFEPN